MARLLLFSTYQHELYGRLAASTDPTLAAIAAKAVKEVAYHHDHARQWVLRLGDGTPTSRERMQAALDAEWPWARELFDASWLDPALVDAASPSIPASSRRPRSTGSAPCWPRRRSPCRPRGPAVSDGRDGRHTEALGYLLAEMQHLARSHPGATW